jgi:hypothetical protein
MSKSKYIMVQMGGFEQPFVFSETMQHKDVAHALTHGELDRVVSAGFCHINVDGRYTCYGESYSLKVSSREKDSSVMNRMLQPDF